MAKHEAKPIDSIQVGRKLQVKNPKGVVKIKPKLKDKPITTEEAIAPELKLFSKVKVNVNRFFPSDKYSGIYIGTTPDGMVLIDFNETGLGAFQGTPLHKNGIVEFSPDEVYFNGVTLSKMSLLDKKPPLLYHRKPTMRAS